MELVPTAMLTESLAAVLARQHRAGPCVHRALSVHRTLGKVGARRARHGERSVWTERLVLTERSTRTERPVWQGPVLWVLWTGDRSV